MSPAREEWPITARVDERPAVHLSKIREVKPKHLIVRFLAGALTSVVAGLVTLAFGARVGGLMLAFPAILGASLTLIADQEDSAEAREDARGAVMGGLAMAAFAAVAAVSFGHMGGALALLLAAATWFVVAFAGYAIAWFK